MWEYGFAVLWNSDKTVLSELTKRFNKNSVSKVVTTVTVTPKSRVARDSIIDTIYPNPKLKVKDNCPRRVENTPITIMVVRDNVPVYEMQERAEGRVPCNMNFLHAKKEVRKIRQPRHFHVTDHVGEANDVVKAFGLKAYTHPFIMLDLNKAHGVLVKKDRSYRAVVRLFDTPHYLYLQGHRAMYKDFITDHDQIHRADWKPSITPAKYHAAAGIPQVVRHAGRWLIKDGLHRLCIMHQRHGFTRCKVEVVDYHLSNLPAEPELRHGLLANQFICELRRSGAAHCVVRGWDTLPRAPNTDLDITVAEGAYDAVLKLAHKHLLPINKTQTNGGCRYTAFRTPGPPSKLLPNGHFRFDLYSRTAFFMRAKKHVVSPAFEKALLSGKRHVHNYTIPSPEADLLLTMYRAVYDKGKFKPSYAGKVADCRKRCTAKSFVAVCVADGLAAKDAETLWKRAHDTKAVTAALAKR